MIRDFILAWEKNKKNLEEYIRTHAMGDYDTYQSLTKLLFDIVINPEMTGYREPFDTENILVIDDGDYQGTLIFVLHRNCYQPNTGEYVYTSVNYGSCSGCDTLQAIHIYEYDKLPDEEQVSDYMDLLLHLLQHCHYMKED